MPSELWSDHPVPASRRRHGVVLAPPAPAPQPPRTAPPRPTPWYRAVPQWGLYDPAPTVAVPDAPPPRGWLRLRTPLIVVLCLAGLSALAQPLLAALSRHHPLPILVVEALTNVHVVASAVALMLLVAFLTGQGSWLSRSHVRAAARHHRHPRRPVERAVLLYLPVVQLVGHLWLWGDLLADTAGDPQQLTAARRASGLGLAACALAAVRLLWTLPLALQTGLYVLGVCLTLGALWCCRTLHAAVAAEG